MASGRTAGIGQREPAVWLSSARKDAEISDLARTLGVERVVATVLVSRGYNEPASAREFLYPELNELHDPFAMRDMDRASSRILQAIRVHEPILLYGDYDVDGTCSIVVLKKTIELLGGLADFHIPDRLKDGYGMRSEIICRAAETGVRLIVSVDTGIRATEVVRHANVLGIDVIVTDHHLPDQELPPAHAVLNPNRPDCSYPNKSLCGAGVALKLAQALLSRSEMPDARRAALLDSFLKPVAIATVADIVPLTGENRVIVKRGLAGLKKVRNLGLKALLNVAGLDEGEPPSAHVVAFRLAPRINAAGRMATAKSVVELFLTDDGGRARQLAEELDQLNRERQQAEAEIVDSILEQCGDLPLGDAQSAMVFVGSGWHLGVLGIVASRLVERFGRPVFVLSDAPNPDETGEPCLTGSGRSIVPFHLLEALESMPELFTKFGGHRQAAGLTLRVRDVHDFRHRFNLFATSRLTSEDFRAQHRVDADASLSELTDGCARQLLELGPFGYGNPTPIIRCSGVQVGSAPRPLGSSKHFSVPLVQDGRTLFCKAWNFGDHLASFERGRRFDVLLQVEDDPYSKKRGYGSWCLTLRDFRTSESVR